ncbi:unnamed protein product, partial [marine sediment metagenome]
MVITVSSSFYSLKDAAFVQAESEIAAINMVYGAASTGAR